MRQLKIALQGHGRAINAIRLALEPYGHRWVDNAEDADLVIDDGSASAPFCGAVVMGLRLGIGRPDSDGLPTLQLRAYTGSGELFAALDVATQHLGNGQRLCRQTLNSLGEWVGVLVSGFARDADHFSQTALANSAPEHPLPALEALAYLHRYNRTATPVLLEDARVPIIERLQDSLLKFAARPALNIDGQVYSYRQLHQQSLAIQEALRPLLANSKNRPVVAVCLNKSLALYASILAVLGCTAVYLPLERGHPPERQRRMLEHADVTLLLDEGCHPLREQFTALDVSDLPPQPSVDSPLMQRRPASDEACMALHTSGTTGQPKGVLLTQFNLAHFCTWLTAHVHLNSRSRVLQFSSLSFDSSLIDLFPALIAGAQLIVPTEDQRRDPQQLLALLRRQRVSHGFLPPALLAILPADSPLGLDHLLTGGEPCEPRVIEHLAGQCQVHNLYGPTETTVLATCRTLQAGDSNRNIGTPIANSQIQILDEQMQPVDEEEAGELYIIGPGVGPGYINLPRHTERHYVQLTRPDGRVLPAYRSGDLAKWTKDGIELVGRRDLQVKIRGFRVEPAEIERTLQHSQLFRQVAVVIDDASRIRAFVSGPHPQASPARLKQHARQTLPDYMQPVAYTELPSLPCSANDKIDRQALQAVPLEHTATGDRQSPQTPLGKADSTVERLARCAGHTVVDRRQLLQPRRPLHPAVDPAAAYP
ncbi:MAG: Linear gramicidin synthase subunit D [Pseudomonas fluorescens]|nr:MAG: Linear gramicidin synthase subunit D [Pseudomonas fluorescens]